MKQRRGTRKPGSRTSCGPWVVNEGSLVTRRRRKCRGGPCGFPFVRQRRGPLSGLLVSIKGSRPFDTCPCPMHVAWRAEVAAKEAAERAAEQARPVLMHRTRAARVQPGVTP